MYATLPQCKAFMKAATSESMRHIFLKGMLASSTPVFFAGVASKLPLTCLFVLQDTDEAGYFYHDLTQILGTDNVLFYPSSYRRAVKYGQRDSANEILRTEALSRLAAVEGKGKRSDSSAKSQQGAYLYVVTCPEALSELVVSKRRLDERTINIAVGDIVNLADLGRQLREFGFKEEDYVYEPGQFAMRGSIVDVYSYSSELPFRIDFFGDEVDTIRTFEVADQLSKDHKKDIQIVPELAQIVEDKQPFTALLPDDATLVIKDRLYLCSAVEKIYDEGFSSQALASRLEGATEMEQEQIMRDMRKENNLVSGVRFREEICKFRFVEFGPQPTGTPQATIAFSISPQPLFHKNFELLAKTLEDYLLQGYKLYILADSEKQTRRLKEIFESDELKALRNIHHDKSPNSEALSVADRLEFTPVDHTLHEGFADNDLRLCFFTDHQIFDRFHKYNLK